MIASPSNPTILIVDDEALVRVMLTDVFEDAGFAVREASTAAEAIGMLEGMEYCIDLVLTDVKMPGDVDGLALASWTREHCPAAKIVVMTAYAGAHRPDEVHAYDAFFRKPFNPAQLVATALALL